jgi:hypothetical protein
MSKVFTNQLATVIGGELTGTTVMVLRGIGAGLLLVTTSDGRTFALPGADLRLWKSVTEIDTRMSTQLDPQ